MFLAITVFRMDRIDSYKFYIVTRGSHEFSKKKKKKKKKKINYISFSHR